MQLTTALSGAPLFDEGMAFLNEHDPAGPSWRDDPMSMTMWVLHGEGGRFDEVTEQVTGRPIVSVLAVRVSDYSTRARLAVHPNYRQQGWGKRMVRRLLQQDYGHVTTEVRVLDQAAMQFAVRYGTIANVIVDRLGSSRQEAWATVQFTLEEAWPHGRCTCYRCRQDLLLLGSRTGRQRVGRDY